MNLGTIPDSWRERALPDVTAVVLSAIYLLWSYQRVAYGPAREEHRHLPDLSAREVVVLAPVLALLLVLGVYPTLATRSIDPTSKSVVEQVAPAGRITDVGPSEARVVAAVNGGGNG